MLAGWDNFYVIVGSSGAALIGLQFVVIALIKDTRMRTTSGALSAFGTPTVLHLGGALVISALMSAPWQTVGARALAMGTCGIVGLAYSAGVTIHARRQSSYAPVWEDWLWHIILPIGAYASLTLGALLLRSFTHGAAFAIAGAALGLLLIAIHNAWDTVVYVVMQTNEERATGEEPGHERR